MLSLWERRRMRCSQMLIIEHHFNLNSSNERTTLAMLTRTLDGCLDDWSLEKHKITQYRNEQITADKINLQLQRGRMLRKVTRDR